MRGPRAKGHREGGAEGADSVAEPYCTQRVAGWLRLGPDVPLHPADQIITHPSEMGILSIPSNDPNPVSRPLYVYGEADLTVAGGPAAWNCSLSMNLIGHNLDRAGLFTSHEIISRSS